MLYGQSNYDPRLHSRVRVDANALRAKLQEYYSSAGAGDEIQIEIPKGAYVAIFKFRTAESHSSRLKWAAATIAAIALVGVSVALWAGRRPESMSGADQPVRLTFDNGHDNVPTLSADGEVMAYESDRGKDGYVHIWLESHGGPPKQITFGRGHDFRPEISPDGTQLAFRSLGGGDGVYVQPVSGGAPKLLVRRAYAQRFSPDGRRLAYAGVGEGDEWHIFVVDHEGRTAPRRIDFGAGEAACPIWTPDGRYVVYFVEEGEDRDYWIAPVDGDHAPARRLGVQASLGKANHPLLTSTGDCPQDWIGDKLLFRVEGKEARDPINNALSLGNIFRVPLSRSDWTLAGAVEPLSPTVSTGFIRVARNKRWFVFNASRYINSVWALSASGSKPPELTRVAQDPVMVGGSHGTWPGLSTDGDLVCFVLQRYGKPDIVCRDLKSGRENILNAHPATGSPVYPDKLGRRVAFLRDVQGKADLVVRDVSSGDERLISSGCPNLFQWSFDGESFVCAAPSGNPREHHLYRVWLSTGKRVHLLTFKAAEDEAKAQAQISPDGRWLALVVGTGRNGLTRGHLIQLGPESGDVSKWVTVTEEPFNLSLHWRPDGNAVYFWQIRDGSRCLWEQRLDATTKRPVGAPSAVLHRHGIQGYPMGGGTLSVGGSSDQLRFAMTLSDELSELWRLPIR